MMLSELAFIFQKGHLDIVRFLVGEGNCAYVEDVAGKTALPYASTNKH